MSWRAIITTRGAGRLAWWDIELSEVSSERAASALVAGRPVPTRLIPREDHGSHFGTQAGAERKARRLIDRLERQDRAYRRFVVSS